MLPLSFWAWLVVAAVCVLYELADTEMLSLSFGLGALAAATAVLLGLGPGWQWGSFFAVTLAGFVLLARWWAQGR